MLQQITSLVAALEGLSSPLHKRVCIGFDGAVDMLVRPVRQIGPEGRPEHFRTIGEFGQYLCRREGRSCTIDVSTIVEKPGGNMVNLAAALGSLTVPVDCVGTLGQPEPLAPFAALPPCCTLHTAGHAGNCFALEFNDGKVMLAQMDRANQLDFEQLVASVGMEQLRQLFGQADLTAFVNWSEINASTELWQSLLEEVFLRQAPEKSRFLLVDMTDCARHPAPSIREALTVLRAYTALRTTVISLNQTEAEQLAGVLNIDTAENLSTLALALWQQLGVDIVVIHPVDSAVGVQAGKVFHSKGFFTPHPAITTGGGDNYNAGFALGLLCGMALPDALLMGNVVAGYYVRNGHSPSWEETVAFLQEEPNKQQEGDNR